jgi:cell wall-associated NlpC family hydrolase
MRFLTLLALLGSLFFVMTANAEPAESSDGASRFIGDVNLMDKIGDVGSRLGEVSNRLGEVSSRIGEVSNRMEAKASTLVIGALGFLGVPYRRGGNDAATGFDCSGFVRAIYQQTAGLLLPRRAAEQAAATETIDKAELKPGDLVFFNTMRRAFSHVGIYVGNGKFIHAPKPGGEVRVEDMGASYWTKRFDGARRVPVEANASATPQQ